MVLYGWSIVSMPDRCICIMSQAMFFVFTPSLSSSGELSLDDIGLELGLLIEEIGDQV
jgi:hypothetical protein